LEIVSPSEFHEIDQLIHDCVKGQLLFFTSANGVRIFVERANELSPYVLTNFCVAVVGEKTAKAAKESGLNVVFTANESSAEGLAKEFLEQAVVQKLIANQTPVTILRGNIANLELGKCLSTAGLIVKEIVVYHIELPEVSRELMREFILRLGCVIPGNVTESSSTREAIIKSEASIAGAILFTSSQAIRNVFKIIEAQFVEEADAVKHALRKIPSFVIGEQTAKTAREHQLNLAGIADKQTMESLVYSLVLYFGN
jgi:uroporphyrinogen III methyltransferase/synthase